MLHDGWGSPKPMSDAELEQLRRRDWWSDMLLLGICGVLLLGAAVLILLMFVG